MKRLSGRRILVVGASSGIGMAAARVLAEEGARVAAAARRTDRLEEVDALTVPCDVRDPASCEAAIAASVEGLGGLDAFVYVTGIAKIRYLADATPEDWREAFETNTVGAALLTRAALPHLAAAERGRALYVSSIAALDHPPRRGLGLYITSKAALDKMITVFQIENPGVSFTRVSVGDTGSTEMGSSWDLGRDSGQIHEWKERGLMFGRAMAPESVGRHLADLLASEEAVPVSSIVPHYRTD